MSDWSAWAARRRWPRGYALEHTPFQYRRDVGLGMLICVSLLVWSECFGPDDPFCGLCRFSTHGCNDGGPSRAEYIRWLPR